VTVIVGPFSRLRVRVGRPSAALLVASLALTMSVAGTAYAALIIKSNAEVASNVIAGQHPPSGDHPNIIPGSINDKDVQANGITGAAVKESTLTGNAIALLYQAKCCPSLSETFPSLAGFAVRVRCYSPDNYYVWVGLDVLSTTGGEVNGMFEKTASDTTDNGNTSGEWTVAAHSRQLGVATQDVPPGFFARVSGTLMLHRGASLVQVDFHAVADNRASTKGCSLFGAETLGTVVAGTYH
jgi:hypothetical protein